ncbi:MAG TPA: hypothetical protein EYN64_00655, partial [Flavobacteriales bacterium]|nr:hypothetical protein [Flavobacteriales bacterium]
MIYGDEMVEFILDMNENAANILTNQKLRNVLGEDAKMLAEPRQNIDPQFSLNYFVRNEFNTLIENMQNDGYACEEIWEAMDFTCAGYKNFEDNRDQIEDLVEDQNNPPAEIEFDFLNVFLSKVGYDYQGFRTIGQGHDQVNGGFLSHAYKYFYFFGPFGNIPNGFCSIAANHDDCRCRIPNISFDNFDNEEICDVLQNPEMAWDRNDNNAMLDWNNRNAWTHEQWLSFNNCVVSGEQPFPFDLNDFIASLVQQKADLEARSEESCRQLIPSFGQAARNYLEERGQGFNNLDVILMTLLMFHECIDHGNIDILLADGVADINAVNEFRDIIGLGTPQQMYDLMRIMTYSVEVLPFDSQFDEYDCPGGFIISNDPPFNAPVPEEIQALFRDMVLAQTEHAIAALIHAGGGWLTENDIPLLNELWCDFQLNIDADSEYELAFDDNVECTLNIREITFSQSYTTFDGLQHQRNEGPWQFVCDQVCLQMPALVNGFILGWIEPEVNIDDSSAIKESSCRERNELIFRDALITERSRLNREGLNELRENYTTACYGQLD